MKIKVELPKQFYTPEQLAERWECKVEDITHLIETKLLEHAHKGALRSGHRYIRVVAVETEQQAVQCINEQKDSTVLYFPVINRRPGVSKNTTVVLLEIQKMRKRGEFDPVILADEVLRYEREHGEPTEDAAPPSSWPWGEYETPLLRVLADAVKHWRPDSNHQDLWPKKESGEVADWIMERMKTDGLDSSKELAKYIETLIAPRKYAHQRQRKQK